MSSTGRSWSAHGTTRTSATPSDTSSTLTFAYADATTLRIQGYYVKGPDGWVDYQHGEAEPSF